MQGVPDGLQEFKDGLGDEHVLNTETLPVRLMNYLRSREQKWYPVSTAFSLPEGIEIAISA